MSKEDVKAVVRGFYTMLFADPVAAEAWVAADYVDHNSAQAVVGPNGFRAHVAGVRNTFPDFELEIEDMFADRDHVITRVTGRGTHTGKWMGIEPTGRIVNLKGINIDRVSNGLIVEHWGEADTITMLVQMGVDPFARH